MGRIRFLVASLLALCIAVPAGASGLGQDSTASKKVWKVVLKDGSEFIGYLDRETPDSLTLRTPGGATLAVSRLMVESMRPLSGTIIGGQYRRVDPNRTRLFFAPTARGLSAGEGYFSAYELFFPFAAVGVADIVTLGAGVTLIPGATGQLLYLAPKIIIPLESESVGVAAGVLYFAGLGDAASDLNPGGIIYGLGTFGSKYAAFTAGLGYGFAEGKFADDPVLLLGGEVQLSGSVKLLSENWIPIGSDIALLSFGIRFFGESLAADLGFIYPAGAEDIEGWPFFPWIGFTYNFGGK